MVEKVVTPGRNVINFLSYQQGRKSAAAMPLAIAGNCRHCGAALSEGESEDDCSSAMLRCESAVPRAPALRLYAE